MGGGGIYWLTAKNNEGSSEIRVGIIEGFKTVQNSIELQQFHNVAPLKNYQYNNLSSVGIVR
jgi:hypothetical protein